MGLDVRTRWATLIVVTVVAAACGVTSQARQPATQPAADRAEAPTTTNRSTTATPSTASTSSSATTTDSTVIEYYPDANVRELWRRMARPRPVPNSALPPRHLDVDRFPDTLVDRSLIVSGGPPPDGIQPIDEPSLVPAGMVDWLAPEEAVLALTIDDTTHLYPVQIMLWHEIVNDRVGTVPVTVSYCPLCNSAVGYDRRVDDRVLDFGTSGSLYQSALVMYDRQTESLWTHFDGRAVVGELMGAELEIMPVVTVSWADALDRWPDALVLDRPGSLRPYGTNPYPAYEAVDEPLPGFFSGEADPRLPARARVVGLRNDELAVAVKRSLIEAEGSLLVEVGELTVRLVHRPGTRSPLDGTDVAAGVDIGSITAVAVETGSGFTAGSPVPMLDTFWFAWAAYNPDTTIVERPDPAAASTD